MNRTTATLVSIAALVLGACGSDDEDGSDPSGASGNNGHGHALTSAHGHSFQFYSKSGKWVFSVSISSAGQVYPVLQDGLVAFGDAEFDYQKTGIREATCLLFVGYAYMLGGSMYYGTYYGDMLLTFDSSRGGHYKIYDWYVETKLISEGKFTVDDD